MPQPAADGAICSATAAKRVKDVQAADLTRRCETGQKARNEADSGGKHEHSHVDSRLERVSCRCVRAKHAHEDRRQAEAKRATHRRQQHAFRQELSCDSARAGAQRPPHRNFTGARDAACKEQSSHVGRRDQEHQGHHQRSHRPRAAPESAARRDQTASEHRRHVEPETVFHGFGQRTSPIGGRRSTIPPLAVD